MHQLIYQSICMIHNKCKGDNIDKLLKKNNKTHEKREKR